MHRPLKSASLIAATLLLSLASPLEGIGITLKISKALAQASTSQDQTAKEVAMPEASPVERFQILITLFQLPMRVCPSGLMATDMD